jgi:hypothetical protein
MKRTISGLSGTGSLDLDAETPRHGGSQSGKPLLVFSAWTPRLCVSASKIVISTILIILTAGLSFAAETAEQRGKRVVDEAIAALGGDAFLRVQDRVESGRAYSFYNGRISGLSIAAIYTRYLSHPGPPVIGRLEVEEKEAFGKEENSGFVLFTDKPEGWDVTFRGARTLDDERLASYIDNTLHNVFYMLRKRMNEPGFSYYSKGSDLYENRPVNIVDITGGDDVTVTVYFDGFTKLPTRQVHKRRNNEYHDFDTLVSAYAKYRNVGGGVQWPLDIRRERNGDKIYEMFSESVEINKGLRDELFHLPGNVKFLTGK